MNLNKVSAKTWLILDGIIILMTTLMFALQHEWFSIGIYFTGLILGGAIMLQFYRLLRGE